MRKIIFQQLFVLCTVVLTFAACQKEISGNLGNPIDTPVELGSKVTTSVSGFVTDENDAPVQGAAVKIGLQTLTTDQYGYFAVSNVSLTKNAATVTVNSGGYFPGIRTFIAAAGKTSFVRIKLLPKTNNGTISAVNGGSVALPNGLKISLPANAVVNAASNAAYSGTIHVAAQWINPVAADLDRIMPGDLRAIDTDNNMKLLTTYGMAAVELTGGSGEKLQIATGKKATLTMPLPPSIAGTAPATIPLWYFDESIGLWKEEGSASRVGNTYEGEVSHFSFWNCDVPNNYVQLNMTVQDVSGDPISFAYVKVTNTGNNQWATGITDATGYVQGAVPANSQLLVEVFTTHNCATPIYSQTITTTTSNVSLGTINVGNNTNAATIAGTVTNCSNAPVTTGSLLVKMNNVYYRYPVSNTGSFNIPTLLCNATSLPVEVIAEDIATSQQSPQATFTIVPGANNIGNLQACGISTSQFLNITINGTPHSFTAPADSLTYYNNNQTSATVHAFTPTITGASSSVNLLFSNISLGVGSNQSVIEFTTNIIPEAITIAPASVVNITEYGPVGAFIAGTFTTTATGVALPNTTYNITCNFRIRRYN